MSSCAPAERAERAADQRGPPLLANEDLVEQQEDQRGSEHDAEADAAPACVGDRVRREAVEQRTRRRGEMAGDVAPEAQVRAPRRERERRGLYDVERHDRAEQQRHRRDHDARQEDRRVPEQVHAVHRIDVMREEGVQPVRDGVGVPAQEPHEQRRDRPGRRSTSCAATPTRARTTGPRGPCRRSAARARADAGDSRLAAPPRHPRWRPRDLGASDVSAGRPGRLARSVERGEEVGDAGDEHAAGRIERVHAGDDAGTQARASA